MSSRETDWATNKFVLSLIGGWFMRNSSKNPVFILFFLVVVHTFFLQSWSDDVSDEKWNVSVSEEACTTGAAEREEERILPAHRLSSPDKVQLNVTIATQRFDTKQSSGGDGGISTERADKIPSGGAQMTLSHSKKIFLFVIYIWGSGCPLVSSRRHESQSCLPPLTTTEASLSATDSYNPL